MCWNRQVTTVLRDNHHFSNITKLKKKHTHTHTHTHFLTPWSFHWVAHFEKCLASDVNLTKRSVSISWELHVQTFPIWTVVVLNFGPCAQDEHSHYLCTWVACLFFSNWKFWTWDYKQCGWWRWLTRAWATSTTCL